MLGIGCSLDKYRAAPAGSAWAPTDLGGLVLWLKADAGVLTDVDGVYEWQDQSPASHTAMSQSTGSAKPQLVDPWINGMPGIQGDGIDDYITDWIGSDPLVSDFPYTIAFVGRVTDLAETKGVVGRYNSSGPSIGVGQWDNVYAGSYPDYQGVSLAELGGPSGPFPADDVNVAWVLSVDADGYGSMVANGGVDVTPDPQKLTDFSSTQQWDYYCKQSVNCLTHIYGEICFWNQDHTSEFSTIKSYLESRWGLD